MHCELRPSTLEEARLFVGTAVERYFRTHKHDGWYRATISEVNRGCDLNLDGVDAADFWCLLRYEPDGEGAEDAEDQRWGFVFDDPQRCRVRCGGAELHAAAHGGVVQPRPAAAAMASPSVPAAWEGLSHHLETAYAAVLPLPNVAGASGLAAAFEALELLRGLGGLGEAELMSFKMLLLADGERREAVWRELRRLVLRRSWAAAVAWLRSCVSLLGCSAAGTAGRATGLVG